MVGENGAESGLSVQIGKDGLVKCAGLADSSNNETINTRHTQGLSDISIESNEVQKYLSSLIWAAIADLNNESAFKFKKTLK